ALAGWPAGRLPRERQRLLRALRPRPAEPPDADGRASRRGNRARVRRELARYARVVAPRREHRVLADDAARDAERLARRPDERPRAPPDPRDASGHSGRRARRSPVGALPNVRWTRDPRVPVRAARGDARRLPPGDRADPRRSRLPGAAGLRPNHPVLRPPRLRRARAERPRLERLRQ